jgi:hypothetical protein
MTKTLGTNLLAGFSLVTPALEEMQQKAIAEINGKDIERREIAVKVAIDSPDKTAEEANAPEHHEEHAYEAANGTGEEAAVTAPAA